MKEKIIAETLDYLTDELPGRYGYLEIVSQKLNTDGKLTKKGLPYTPNIVNNVVRGRYPDDNVKTYLAAEVSNYLSQVAEQKRLSSALRKQLRATKTALLSA